MGNQIALDIQCITMLTVRFDGHDGSIYRGNRIYGLHLFRDLELVVNEKILSFCSAFYALSIHSQQMLDVEKPCAPLQPVFPNVLLILRDQITSFWKLPHMYNKARFMPITIASQSGYLFHAAWGCFTPLWPWYRAHTALPYTSSRKR